jgi:hypothetical protein
MRPALFASLIVAEEICYLMREVESDVVWVRGVRYDKKLVLDRIKTLPCCFIVTADNLRAMLPRIRSKQIATFDYSYRGEGKKYDWRPANNTEKELGPQYEFA